MGHDELVTAGDHPVLDFLNSTATPAGAELICDGSAYVRWLQRTGLINDAEHRAILSRFGSNELDIAAQAAVELREMLRPAIAAWVRGAATPSTTRRCVA
jgi:hypothetical protein